MHRRIRACSEGLDTEGVGEDELPPERVPDSVADTFSIAGAHSDYIQWCCPATKPAVAHVVCLNRTARSTATVPGR